VVLNDYYSQCQPGTAASTTLRTTTSTTLRTTTSSTRSSTTPASQCTTTITITTSTPTRTTSSPSRTTTTTKPATTTTPSGTGAGSTLQTGYTWIRAVAAPNFHKYLQTSPLNAAPGTAILSSATTAGQFQIVDGQLIELIDTKGTKLYASVGEAPSASATYLPVTFTAAKNSFGAFAYQGDTLTWSSEGVKRQNVAAWYVCENQSLWINLGAYLYGTPAGCVDQTVSVFFGFCLSCLFSMRNVGDIVGLFRDAC
jgi:hypothetical protein